MYDYSDPKTVLALVYSWDLKGLRATARMLYLIKDGNEEAFSLTAGDEWFTDWDESFSSRARLLAWAAGNSETNITMGYLVVRSLRIGFEIPEDSGIDVDIDIDRALQRDTHGELTNTIADRMQTNGWSAVEIDLFIGAARAIRRKDK